VSSLIVALAELPISSTGLYGLLMNFIGTAAFSVTVSLVYKWRKNFLSAILGLVSGVLAMTAVMLAFNLLVTPYYMHVDVSVVWGMIPSLFLPFNLVKGGLNAALAMLLYKPVVGALRRVGLVAQSSSGKKGRFSLGSTLAAAAVLATFVLLFLILIDVI
jgi:riboflavin transporter FmnP